MDRTTGTTSGLPAAGPADMDLALPPAVVFDCDGTIADTESLSDRAWSETLDAHGYTATSDDFQAVIGRPYAHNWDYFSARVDLGDPALFRTRLRERFVELFEAELEVYDDAVHTLRVLAGAGVRIGVASSSSHKHVLRVLDQGDLRDLVDVVVGADDVERHKPDPEPYVTAARELGVGPDRCSAVEDTAVGVASATGAGMFTVGVVRRYTVPADLAGADRVVKVVTPDALVPGPEGATGQDLGMPGSDGPV